MTVSRQFGGSRFEEIPAMFYGKSYQWSVVTLSSNTLPRTVPGTLSSKNSEFLHLYSLSISLLLHNVWLYVWLIMCVFGIYWAFLFKKV